MKKEIQIYIDLINDDTIQGWFINPVKPENNRIFLYLDGHYKSVTVANIERQDVADTHGKLESGFSFNIKKFPDFQKIEIRSENKDLLLSLEEFDREKELHSDSKPVDNISHYSQDHQERLEKITIDMSRPVNGDNWYDIEPTGRWGGPELESSLKIPALAEGSYQLQLDIEGTFCDLQAMQLKVNNKPVKFLNTQYDAPVILQAEVIVKKQYPFWLLSFNYPKTCPPGGDSGADQRKLGIFLKRVVLTKITSSQSLIS